MGEERNSSRIDDRILQIASELRSQLEINPFFSMKRVRWLDRIVEGRGPSRVVHSDECEIQADLLILPERMRLVLDPEDWRPLLASAMVYQDKLSGARARHVLKKWGLGFFLPLSLLVTLSIVLFWPTAVIGIPGIILGMFVMIIVPANYVSAPWAKRVRLQADLIAANTIDRNNFLKVLRKLDMLRIEDLVKLEQRKGLRARLTPRPSIAERIQNLTSNRPDNATNV